MVLLFARNTPDRSSLKKSATECRLKRHFSCRVNSWKCDRMKSTADDSSSNNGDTGDENRRILSTFSASGVPNFEKSTTMATAASPTPRHQTACAHRSLPRYYSNNHGKQNVGSGFGAANGIVYSASSSPYAGGQPLLACDDSYLASVRKGDCFDSSLMENYEFSTDFQQKRVEILERKYGGRIAARHAAVVIQRAFREYRLKKKFEDLRLGATEGQRRGEKNKVVLNRFRSATSTAPFAGAGPTRRSLLDQHLLQFSPQHRQHYNAHCAKKITSTRSDGQILFMDARHVAASSDAISQESSPDGQHAKKPRGLGVVLGNQRDVNSASLLSSNNDNATPRDQRGGVGASKLKLHRYDAGGGLCHHLSAPLTVQLHHAQQQQSPPPRGSVLQKPQGSSIHVKVTEVGSTGVVVSSEADETRQNGNRYRPPAVSILRNRSVSVERTALFGGGGYSLSLAAEKETHSTTREERARVHDSQPRNNQYVPGNQQRLREQRGSDFSYASFVRLTPSAVTQQHSSLDNGANGVASSSRPMGRTASTPQQFVSPNFCPINHSTRSTPMEMLSPSSAFSTAALTIGEQGATPSSLLDGSPPVSQTKPAKSTPMNQVIKCTSGVVRSVDLDRVTPVWLPIDLESGCQEQCRPRASTSELQSPTLEKDESIHISEEPPQRPILSRSLPESQWLRHWGRRSLISVPHRQSELERKRQYRIALNFFNKKPERGVQFLVDFGFVVGTPTDVAKLLISRKGLSKQMIGDYLGNLQNPFNMAVLECFANEIDMNGVELDVALRRFQSLFRLPGEAQKIERIVEVFARRYCECNPDIVRHFRQTDTIFILAFAIIMLNTDLHSPSIKPERRMKVEDFMKNLRGIDGGGDVNLNLLTGIYHRVREQEFKPGSDHVTQVQRVDRSVVGKKPTLPLPHRRLVCYCRLYEVVDSQKKQASNVHQREIFLFNDLLLITKILSRKKNTVTYTFRSCHTLVGMQVQPFKNQHYGNGLRINHTLENKVLIFNARSEEDRSKFMEDLKEAICESDEMEALRIELELEKQNKYCGGVTGASTQSRSHSLGRGEQRDSGLPELDDRGSTGSAGTSDAAAAAAAAGAVRRSAAGTSSQPGDAVPRCSSLTSLDSGMSSTASTVSRESSPKNSRPLAAQSDSTPTRSLDGAAASSSGSCVGSARSRPSRPFNGSSTPPPDATFFTESSEV